MMIVILIIIMMWTVNNEDDDDNDDDNNDDDDDYDDDDDDDDVTGLISTVNQPGVNDTEANTKILNILMKLREILPDSTEVIMKLGEKYGDLGHHKQAIELLQKAIDLDPFFVLARTVLAINLAKLQRYEEAEASFQKACELSPGLWDIHKEYGMYLFQRGKYAEAVPVFKRGTELRPDLLPFWSYLKNAQERSGDEKGAKATQRTIDHLKAAQG
nr:hypothetical protein BaRGS_026196 [Batillaria attramentaria]